MRRVIDDVLADPDRDTVRDALARCGQPWSGEPLAEISLAKNQPFDPGGYRGPGPGGLVQVRAFGSNWHEAHWVAGPIAETIAAGTPGPEILVLARAHYATQPAQTALTCAGVPHRVLGRLGLYERPEAKDALAYLTLLANPADGQAFSRAVQSARHGVGRATIGPLRRLSR